eukprot:gnl/MRDRNA2_/MRDRNA2_74544_c0_seq2.p1 gnl/MRDRNA2_/MRDRNA2_74544_c0~~gnl/MRDRNA2_/MRDRNA2_74544_c0_seq2.p1  ORF type:complete len:429 (-),score=52.07 gnl/MRDRNA2_/MRDRNA2_74544_c0_seq2:867-2153(-)
MVWFQVRRVESLPRYKRITEPESDCDTQNGSNVPDSGYRFKGAATRKANSLFSHDAMRLLPLFRGRDPCFVEALLDDVSVVIFQSGDVILSEGESGDSMYLINRGDVEIIVGGKTVTTLSNGSVFGEIALLGVSMRRTATVRAASFCDCRVIHRAALTRLLRLFPADRLWFEEEARRRLQELQGSQGSETKSKSPRLPVSVWSEQSKEKTQMPERESSIPRFLKPQQHPRLRRLTKAYQNSTEAIYQSPRSSARNNSFEDQFTQVQGKRRQSAPCSPVLDSRLPPVPKASSSPDSTDEDTYHVMSSPAVMSADVGACPTSPKTAPPTPKFHRSCHESRKPAVAVAEEHGSLSGDIGACPASPKTATTTPKFHRSCHELGKPTVAVVDEYADVREYLHGNPHGFARTTFPCGKAKPANPYFITRKTSAS